MSISATHSIWAVLALTFLINLPFGYWRARVRKLSPPWFVAVHVPVVLAIALRLVARIPFRLTTLPLFVVVFFAGQLVGGKVRGWIAGRV